VTLPKCSIDSKNIRAFADTLGRDSPLSELYQAWHAPFFGEYTWTGVSDIEHSRFGIQRGIPKLTFLGPEADFRGIGHFVDLLEDQ